MPQSDFYNHNRFRAYPLKSLAESGFPFGAGRLPESAILDAGFVLGIDAAYDPRYRVQLVGVEVSFYGPGYTVTFEFQDEATTATFRLSFDGDDPAGTIQEADAVEGATYGTAWVVGGDMAAVREALGYGSFAPGETIHVEEGTVQTLHKHYVKQFGIATQPDTQWHMPTDCGGEERDIWRYRVTGRDLRGHRKFKPGYNAVISVVDRDNAIEIGTGIGAGEGEPCERVEFYSSSSWLALSSASMSSISMSSGYVIPAIAAPACKDIVNTINGVWPDALGNFSLTALSSGLTITAYPEEHKVVVAFMSGAYSPFCETQYEGSRSSEGGGGGAGGSSMSSSSLVSLSSAAP